MLFYAAALVSDYASLSGSNTNIFPYMVMPEQTVKQRGKLIVVQNSQVLPIRDITLDKLAIVSTTNSNRSQEALLAVYPSHLFALSQ